MASKPKILQPREPILDGIGQDGRQVTGENGRPLPRQGVARSWWQFFNKLAEMAGTLMNGLTIPANSIFQAGDFSHGGTLELQTIAARTLLGNSGTVAAAASPQAVDSSLSFENGVLGAALVPARSLWGNAGTVAAIGGAITVGANLSLTEAGVLNATPGSETASPLIKTIAYWGM